MDKIAELCAAEQKFIEKLQLVSSTYGQLLYASSDAEIETCVRMDSFPSLQNQHKDIVKFYNRMLHVHSELFEFWTHSIEDYLNVDRCGQLFYHSLIEERFDVYLEHIVANPLRHRAVQEDFTGFIEQSLDTCDEEILLLTGYECFRFPLDHLQFYERAFSGILDSGRVSQSVANATRLLRDLLKRIREAGKLSQIQSLELFLPRLGTYLMSSEFSIRDYSEGQQHKAELFLFSGGILVAKEKKGLSLFKRESDLLYDSHYQMEQIELDVDCFRLKDSESKLTCFKVTEKRRELLKWDQPKVMSKFLKQIGKIKRIHRMEITGISCLGYDLGDREAINLECVKGTRKLHSDRGELCSFKTDKLIRTSFNSCLPLVEAFNVRLCDAVVFNRYAGEGMEQINYKLPETPKDLWRRVYQETIKNSQRWSKY